MHSVFVKSCLDDGLLRRSADSDRLAPALRLVVDPPHWRTVALRARDHGFRFSAFWGDQRDGILRASCALDAGGQLLVLETTAGQDAELPSLAGVYPAADRPERHARDLLGLRISDAPDHRRWTRHAAWGEHEYPLQAADRPLPTGPTPPDDGYPFVSAHGPGVVEIAVGPVHAGIIEPGHFRFHAVGERVLNLEERLGYLHKGIEKIAQGRDPESLARLAGRVSGDSTVAHTWAACQAIETALAVKLPERALWLRALMSERERVANHLGDIGAICNDVGFTFAQSQLSRLKEAWVRGSESAFGHRYMMDAIVPGGVRQDVGSAELATMSEHAAALESEFAELIDRLESSESLEDRLMNTGRLTPEEAQLIGAVGYVGRASGQPCDLRVAAPYAPYDRLSLREPIYRAGDVAARAKLRADEVQIALPLIRELIRELPGGKIRQQVVPAGRETQGLGRVEGWRGDVLCYLRLDDAGRCLRYFPRDPSWLNWPALELLMQRTIVPDFPVCNKSINGSYAGQDL